MIDELHIGPSPTEENCAQLGSDDYRKEARAECKRYIELIRSVNGPEPMSAQLKIKSCPHDFGSYYEVVVLYSDEDEIGMAYAFHVESQGPRTWDDKPGSALFSHPELEAV